MSNTISELKKSSQKVKTRKTISIIISISFVVLWLYASISKVIDYNNFKTQLSESPYIENLSTLLSILIPLSEAVIALLLIIPISRRIGMYLSLVLLSSFTIYIYLMLKYGDYVACPCGGIIGEMGWSTHLWFNITFLSISIIGIIFNNKKRA